MRWLLSELRRIVAVSAYNDLTPAEAHWLYFAAIISIFSALSHLQEHMITLVFQCFFQTVDVPLSHHLPRLPGHGAVRREHGAEQRTILHRWDVDAARDDFSI